jgi:hypothetical protein
MKIEVTLRKDYQGAIIRVPKDVTALDMKTVWELVDRLIVGGARVTDKGRLDFPDRLPFCPNVDCGIYDCIFHKLYQYLRSSGRYGEEETLAIGMCNPIKMADIRFPSIYLPLDNCSEKYYEYEVLPIILRFYDPNFMRGLWRKVWSEK